MELDTLWVLMKRCGGSCPNIDNREVMSGKGVRDWIHCGYTLWPKHCSASQLDREKVEN